MTAGNEALLDDFGFIAGDRDPAMNTSFAGRFMVCEPYEDGQSQPDGSGGVWCVVGDDLDMLMTEAVEFFELESVEPAKADAEGTPL